MAKFRGLIGFATTTKGTDGVWTDEITERTYSGDVLRNVSKLQQGVDVLDNLVVSNSISIIADPFADQNFQAIRWVQWMGAKWKVTTVEVQRPRLLLSIGGVYNEA